MCSDNVKPRVVIGWKDKQQQQKCFVNFFPLLRILAFIQGPDFFLSVALFLYCIVALLHLEVERARDELKLRVSSLNEPEPVKIALEPASSPSFLPIKMLKFES